MSKLVSIVAAVALILGALPLISLAQYGPYGSMMGYGYGLGIIEGIIFIIFWILIIIGIIYLIRALVRGSHGSMEERWKRWDKWKEDRWGKEDRAMDILKERYVLLPGGTTEDGRFSLVIMECIGACGTAPAMLVNTDLHENLTEHNIPEILGKYK